MRTDTPSTSAAAEMSLNLTPFLASHPGMAPASIDPVSAVTTFPASKARTVPVPSQAVQHPAGLKGEK